MVKISEIDLKLWDKSQVKFAPYPDVNILVGVNGSGKTTLLSEITNNILKNKKEENSWIYIPSVDNLEMRDKRKRQTALSQDLDAYIYDMKTGPSLMFYRMSMLDASPALQSRVNGFLYLD